MYVGTRSLNAVSRIVVGRVGICTFEQFSPFHWQKYIWLVKNIAPQFKTKLNKPKFHGLVRNVFVGSAVMVDCWAIDSIAIPIIPCTDLNINSSLYFTSLQQIDNLTWSNYIFYNVKLRNAHHFVHHSRRFVTVNEPDNRFKWVLSINFSCSLFILYEAVAPLKLYTNTSQK